jgi:hypothetical protein
MDTEDTMALDSLTAIQPVTSHDVYCDVLHAIRDYCRTHGVEPSVVSVPRTLERALAQYAADSNDDLADRAFRDAQPTLFGYETIWDAGTFQLGTPQVLTPYALPRLDIWCALQES